MPNRALVLTYHSANVSGNDYANNDHVALAADLQLIGASGWSFATLDEVLAATLDSADSGDDQRRLIALTCDDGISLDCLDFDHPAHGMQRSFLNILRDFGLAQTRAELPRRLHLSSFVIASPEARRQFDVKDFLSLGLWGDDWWSTATASGLMQIESHSWDHNHPSIDPTAHKNNQRGDFFGIDTQAECDAEILKANGYIASRTGRSPRHFAYPWGQASDYLRREYLPRFGAEMGLVAAWSCEPEPLQAGADRWYLPRFVCGQNWKSPDELQRLLDLHH